MDIYTVKKRSEIMSRIRGKNTSSELTVRGILHRMGHTRYSLHKKDIPGSPDVAISSRKKAIFVNGCFWHHHKNCKLAYRPKSNRHFWLKKIEDNIKRDTNNKRKLTKDNWSYLTIWECELKGHEKVSRKLNRFLSNRINEKI
ncbi:very short patch repair endonuclease [Candidatus Omnitrophota bacterium]